MKNVITITTDHMRMKPAVVKQILGETINCIFQGLGYSLSISAFGDLSRSQISQSPVAKSKQQVFPVTFHDLPNAVFCRFNKIKPMFLPISILHIM